MPTKNNELSPVEVCPPESLLELQAAALDAAANAVVITNQKGTVIWVNFAFQQLTGYSSAEIVGQSTSLLKSGQTPRKFYDEMWRTLLAGRVWRGELVNRRKDGSLYDEEMTITPYQGCNGKATHYIAIKHDITERKKTEEQMRKMGEMLRILSHTADLLQSCFTVEEASGVIASSAGKLFPESSGAVFMFRASQNIVEASRNWGRIPLVEQVFNSDVCWALRRGRLHYPWGDEGAARCAHFGADFRLSTLCIPLVAEGKTMGVLSLLPDTSESLNTPAPMSESDIQLAVSVARHAALSFANLNLRKELRAEALHDSLTGLFNRRHLNEILERDVSNAVRKNRNLGVIMLDVDRFKKFNDTFGHDAGDTVLKALAEYLTKFIRHGDLACRYGGEEFTLILPEASLEDTRRRAEELRTSFQKLPIKHQGIVVGKVTLSLGVAVCPEHGTNPQDLLAAADAALLRAKEGGRNRVLVGEVSINSAS